MAATSVADPNNAKTLPPEVFQMIAKEIYESGGVRDFWAFCLVSHNLYRLALPYLWRRIELDFSKADPTQIRRMINPLQTLYAACVRELIVTLNPQVLESASKGAPSVTWCSSLMPDDFVEKVENGLSRQESLTHLEGLLPLLTNLRILHWNNLDAASDYELQILQRLSPRPILHANIYYKNIMPVEGLLRMRHTKELMGFGGKMRYTMAPLLPWHAQPKYELTLTPDGTTQVSEGQTPLPESPAIAELLVVGLGAQEPFWAPILTSTGLVHTWYRSLTVLELRGCTRTTFFGFCQAMIRSAQELALQVLKITETTGRRSPSKPRISILLDSFSGLHELVLDEFGWNPTRSTALESITHSLAGHARTLKSLVLVARRGWEGTRKRPGYRSPYFLNVQYVQILREMCTNLVSLQLDFPIDAFFDPRAAYHQELIDAAADLKTFPSLRELRMSLVHIGNAKEGIPTTLKPAQAQKLAESVASPSLRHLEFVTGAYPKEWLSEEDAPLLSTSALEQWQAASCMRWVSDRVGDFLPPPGENTLRDRRGHPGGEMGAET